MVDVRLFHHRQELTRVGGQRLDVTPLPFGVNSVECERGFARARQTREDDQLIARQAEIEIAQVVRSRATDIDVFHISLSEQRPTC